MDLIDYVTHHIWNDPQLRAVPRGVIRDVLEVGLQWLTDHLPAETPGSELLAITDWEECESCGHLIDPAKPEGAIVDGDGIWSCDACRVDGGPKIP